MVIAIDRFQLAYMAVPKAACSTVKAMLADADPGIVKPEQHNTGNRWYHQTYPTRRFRPDRFAKYDGYFSFTVVRDPIRRLMSVFTNRVADMKELQNCRRLRNKRPDLPTDPDPDFFFENFYTYRELSSSIRHHTRESRLFTGPDFDKYDRVYRTDEIDILSADLSQRCGKTIRPVQANSSQARLKFDDLNPKAQNVVRPFLAAEYRHLSGYFDDPMT